MENKSTEKYRLIYNSEKKLKDDPYKDWSGTTTYFGKGANYFCSNTKSEIDDKIESFGLKYDENE